jgi:hypothetical protein
MNEYYSPTEASEVTAEMRRMAASIIEGWYEDRPLDIENFLDRMETRLDNGQTLDLGNDPTSPACKALIRYARKVKRELG